MNTLPSKALRASAPANTRPLILLLVMLTAGALTCIATVRYKARPAVVESRIATGGSHGCELANGGVKCWGNNGEGQLGDNSTAARLVPVSVSGLNSGVRAIAAGGYHTCALTDAGAVECWGRNVEGQLGDATQTRRLVPAVVSGLENGVVAIAAGGFHTCALTGSGAIKCWGYNHDGQLGDGSAAVHLTPVAVNGLSERATAIAAGTNHTCAVTGRGGLKCWGYNGEGQVGDRSTSTRFAPVDASLISVPVKDVTAGAFHTCARTDGGWIRLGARGACGERPHS